MIKRIATLRTLVAAGILACFLIVTACERQPDEEKAPETPVSGKLFRSDNAAEEASRETANGQDRVHATSGELPEPGAGEGANDPQNAKPEDTVENAIDPNRADPNDADPKSRDPNRADPKAPDPNAPDPASPVGLFGMTDVPDFAADQDVGEYKPVSFKILAGFEYDTYTVEASIQDGKPTVDAIPAHIRALDQQKVALRGFMVPIDVSRSKARSFLLVRNRMMCCFGIPWSVNEWVFVKMNGEKTAEYVKDIPVTVLGKLAVSENIDSGMIMSIYRMVADDVVNEGGY